MLKIFNKITVYLFSHLVYKNKHKLKYNVNSNRDTNLYTKITRDNSDNTRGNNDNTHGMSC